MMTGIKSPIEVGINASSNRMLITLPVKLGSSAIIRKKKAGLNSLTIKKVGKVIHVT